ncbi:MAG TPA: GNAT family N-acetyltransferase [Chitinophagaceae bacterium]|nr:GNAT family N-acetyltransferase [Chitinophagaceae bacterium]
MEWILRNFESLTNHELYALLRLRTEVFVLEQNCLFQDMDNKDQYCYHLMGWEKDRLAAYTRLVPPGISYNEPSIGRVVTASFARKTGMGKLLMKKSIEEAVSLFGMQPIRISAQLYLKEFYSSFGFIQTGEIYLDDGIEHIEMLLPLQNS